MPKRILSHLTLTIKDSKSIRTVIPAIIAEKLGGLTPDNMLEWVEKKGEIVVKKF